MLDNSLLFIVFCLVGFLSLCYEPESEFIVILCIVARFTTINSIKEGVIWLNEFETVEEAKEKIPSWIEVFHNKLCAHCRLG